MKVRNGFVSNSSSSSFIVYGFSEDDSCEAYNIIEKKLKEEDPSIEEDDIRWSIYCYLKERGIGYLHHEEWNDTEEIGCILEEGSGDRFNESLKKAESSLKKFDEEHHTDFAKDYRVYSVFQTDY